MSDGDKIESILNEQRRFEPSEEFVAAARVGGRARYDELVAEFERDWEGAWARYARAEIDWTRPFSSVYDDSDAPAPRWFADGALNVSANCLDRHLERRGDQTAIIFEDDNGATTKISYRELFERVCRFANGLKDLGVGKGDRVVIYMPMAPEAIVAMQACARIGAVHSVVFGGFSAKSLGERVQDAAAKAVVTADHCLRGGKTIMLKETVDAALGAGANSVERVIVLKRFETDIPMQAGRDVWWHDAVAGKPSVCEPAEMNAEDPLFILYTSGSTGKPKGILHSSAGYLLGAIMSMKWVFDFRPDSDVYWCTADVGWITGHTYVCYGPQT